MGIEVSGTLLIANRACEDLLSKGVSKPLEWRDLSITTSEEGFGDDSRWVEGGLQTAGGRVAHGGGMRVRYNAEKTISYRRIYIYINDEI